MPWGAADEAAPPRRGQRYKSPAELDFYGDFLRGALRSACPACFAEGKMRQEIAPEGREKARLWRVFSIIFSLFPFYSYLPVPLYNVYSCCSV